MTQKEAYEAVKALALAKKWMATYWTLEEEGYQENDGVDYIELLKKWTD